MALNVHTFHIKPRTQHNWDKVARLVDVYESEDGTVECQSRVWASGFGVQGSRFRVLNLGSWIMV